MPKAARSHVKMYLVDTYKLDLSVCQGEILKPNGKMTVKHRKFLPPDFLDGIMWLIPLACKCFETRETFEYQEHLKKLPDAFQDSYHTLIQWGVSTVSHYFLECVA